MPIDVLRANLYRGRINLWVEDRLTREYLSIVWADDPSIAFFVAGGNDGVSAVVKDAGIAGLLNVFGVVDGDTRPTNRDRWMDPNKNFRTFILPVHEIENYLLDEAPLASARLNTQRKDADEIAALLRQEAGRRCWSTAARAVLAELKRRFREDFIGQPPRDLADRESSLRHILDSDWYRALAPNAARSQPADIEALLDDEFERAEDQIRNGSWKTEFAGKEIFRHIGSLIHAPTSAVARPPTRVEFDIDLAKEVGTAQVAAGRIPDDLKALRTALNDRIARATAARP